MDEYMQRLLANGRPEVSEKVNEGVNKLSPQTSVNIIRSAFEFNPIAKLNRFRGPKLIVQTSDEQMQANSLHNQVPDVPATVIEGTSHWPQMDKPELFNEILESFLKELRPT
jgi:pimeloyl-ACP methyl ester carboxylesterase